MQGVFVARIVPKLGGARREKGVNRGVERLEFGLGISYEVQNERGERFVEYVVK